MNNLEKYTDQDRREFWKIYRDLKKNPMLLKIMQLAATLDPDDLKEVTEYAAWLRQENEYPRSRKPASNTVDINKMPILDELETIEKDAADVTKNDCDPIMLTVKNMLAVLCQDVKDMMFCEKPGHNLTQTRLDFCEIIGDLFVRRARSKDQAKKDTITKVIKDLQRVTEILGDLTQAERSCKS